MSPLRGTFSAASARAFSTNVKFVTFSGTVITTWVVPSNVTSIKAIVIGFGGYGGSNSSPYVGGGGGSGGGVVGTRSVTPGETLYIGGGSAGTPTSGGWTYVSQNARFPNTGNNTLGAFTGSNGTNATPSAHGTGGSGGGTSVGTGWTLQSSLSGSVGSDGSAGGTGASFGPFEEFFSTSGVSPGAGANADSFVSGSSFIRIEYASP